MNRSVLKIDQHLSLYRTYMLFRTLGLRHLLVTDKNNRVSGMITRKDLMPFNIEHKVKLLHLDHEYPDQMSMRNSGGIPPEVNVNNHVAMTSVAAANGNAGSTKKQNGADLNSKRTRGGGDSIVEVVHEEEEEEEEEGSIDSGHTSPRTVLANPNATTRF